MKTTRSTHDEAALHARSIILDASRIRMRDLFTRDADRFVYRMPARHGLAAVVVRTSDLREDELLQVLQFRTAQYLAVDMIDPRMVHAAGLRHDPLSGVKADDVHVVVGSVDSGEIYSSIWVRGMPEAPEGTTLRMAERPTISKEEIFGWGVFNHLRVLPDLPLAKIRDVGRFIKNQSLPRTSEASVRAPIEAVAALLHAILGPLRPEIHAVIGDIEDGIADRNLDYFHVPTVLVKSVLPCVADDAWLHRRYLERCCYPYAAVMTDADAVERRLVEVEAALDLPGKTAVRRLVALSRDAHPAPSSLDAGEPVSPLMSFALPQVGVRMDVRRRMVAFGEQLRALPAFASLSGPEATTLGRLMISESIAAGEPFARGDVDSDLVLIEEGTALVWVRYPHGGVSIPREIGPGEMIGQVALVTGGTCSEEARARTPMVVRRLPRFAYDRFLAATAGVDRAIARAAATALATSLEHLEVATTGSGFQPRVAG